MDKIEIINRISYLRVRNGLSQKALSQAIDLNDGYINRLECKKDFLPSMEVLLRIIEVCNSTCEEFFYHNMEDYCQDVQLIKLLKKLDKDKKTALKTLLNL